MQRPDHRQLVGVTDDHHRQRGFVLILVLVITGVVAASAMILLERSRSAAGGTSAAVEVAQARALADAGIARLLQSLRVQDDPLLKGILASAAPVPWRFAGADIRLSFLRESGKADLNAGNLELIQALLEGMDMPSSLRQQALQRIEAARRRPDRLPSVLSLVPACARLTPVARLFEDRFTVLTGSRGVSAAGMAEEQLRRIPGLSSADAEALRDRRSGMLQTDPAFAHLQRFLADEEPIYRLRAESASASGTRMVREAVILLSARAPIIRILLQRDVILPATIACE